MLNKKNKRGSHVGVVLSFILFITFIVFMYVLLDSRVNQERGKASALEYIQGTVLEQVSSELTTASVAGLNPGQNCVELSGFFSATGMSRRIIARDDSGNVLNAGTSVSSLQVNRGTAAFFRVYESEEFEEDLDSISCAGSAYTLGLLKTEDLVFVSRISALMNNYTADYEALKKAMNIGSRDEFGFIFTHNNGTILRTPEQNVTIGVYAGQIPVQYIRTNGAREAGLLTVLVW